MQSIASRRRIIRTIIMTPGINGNWGLPVLFWGPPGGAKSAVIKSESLTLGAHCEIFSPAEKGEGGFGQIPVPVNYPDRGWRITHPIEDWYDNFLRQGESPAGVLFLDELNRVPDESFLNPLLAIIHARVVNSTPLSPRIRPIGAANPPKGTRAAVVLDKAVANRLGHLTWPSMDVDDHIAYMLGGAVNEVTDTIDLKAEEDRIMGLWPAAFAKASGLYSAFIRTRPQLLNVEPADNDPNAGRAWPSPRTWELAVRAMAGSEVNGLEESERQELTQAFIGEGPMHELLAFLRKNDLQNPESLLDGVEKFVHDDSRLDRTMATFASCAALVTPPKSAKRQKRVDTLYSMMLPIAKEMPDLTIPAAMALSAAHLTTQTSSGTEFLRMISPTLLASNFEQHRKMNAEVGK